ncbi:hypothetical protein QTG54_010147 [Skeletonema marinoi]|uniref:CBM6 domain-containing protein n=1 Tax=Skeletonema marinoi TaxID=267567 RepID=A0AAD8Y381_9STRA|nr:hypothetical protein QTG54_010147 [Skeletonema marinoi]
MSTSLRDALATQYALDAATLRQSILDRLRNEFGYEMLSSSKSHPLLIAHRAEREAMSSIEHAKVKTGNLERCKGLVNHAQNKWIAEANRNISTAQSNLDSTTTNEARDAALTDLQHWRNNREEGERALKERLVNMHEAEALHPTAQYELKLAEEEYLKCKQETERILHEHCIKENNVTTCSDMDADLARYQIYVDTKAIAQLAEFASQGYENQILISDLLADDHLLILMAENDGPRGGRYGAAMEIYNSIRLISSRVESSKDAREQEGGPSIFYRLALAVSLEHAVPYPQSNPDTCTDKPKFIDPIMRYLHYENAYLAGELDPAFDTLSTWELTFVVDGEHGTPDEAFSWGREMLCNYRPDLILTKDYTWRYVHSVRTEIKYGSEEGKFDRPDLHFFQNVLMNGGVCGRRAFFGRFILRSFGIPTIARPSPGHGALAHWTPSGWVVCLGPPWGKGSTKEKYGRVNDTDFLEHTRARAKGYSFKRVIRARLIGDIIGGEGKCFGLSSVRGELGLWNVFTLHVQRSLAEETTAPPMAGRRAKTSSTIALCSDHSSTECDEEITMDKGGNINIPACSTSIPNPAMCPSGNGKILFMRSNLGGKQLHYSRIGPHQSFEYNVNVLRAGTYAFSARIVTPSWKQTLLLSLNGSEELINIYLPFTIGKWDTTKPLNLELQGGLNTFTFSRTGDCKGVTIKDFSLELMDWCVD